MYVVEANVPYVPYADRKTATDIRSDWEDVFYVPSLESDVAEYWKALTLATVFRAYYTHVRVVKIHPYGKREVIRECPFTQSHTREWCGYSECRES